MLRCLRNTACGALGINIYLTRYLSEGIKREKVFSFFSETYIPPTRIFLQGFLIRLKAREVETQFRRRSMPTISYSSLSTNTFLLEPRPAYLQPQFFKQVWMYLEVTSFSNAGKSVVIGSRSFMVPFRTFLHHYKLLRNQPIMKSCIHEFNLQFLK